MHAIKCKDTRRTNFIAWLVIVLLALVSMLVAEINTLKTLAISPLIVAVLLGASLGNLCPRLEQFISHTPVLTISTKQILRLGIILYGFRLSLHELAQVGLSGLALATLIVFTTFSLGILLARLIGLDSKSAILISAGSSICGAAAVLATESIVKGGSARVGIAVSTVVVFGTFSMLSYPIVYRLGFFDFTLPQMGLLMGASLHEVAHAVGAGSALGGSAADITVVIKMLRVLMLVPFLFTLGFALSYLRKTKSQDQQSLRQNIPYFALWFVAVLILSSLLNQEYRAQALPWLIQLDNFLLCIAMGALGMSMKKAIFTNAGFKPFVLASALLVWLVGFAYLLVAYVLPVMK
ncbi:MAG: putative sulfate exporter family transporter [Pelistega sp.]|nr:putative sulfate exporter family transporter [Pelistega sp.]